MTARIPPFTSALLFALPAHALAQVASVSNDDTIADLDRINVKGTLSPAPSSPKFTAPLVDTPLSVTVIPENVIEQTNAATLLEALRTVPGITFGAGEGGNPNGDRPFIRGFDSQSSLFVDGVRSSGSQSRETFAIDQIEVIKGPSSSYTGRGAVGGSINLVSKTPQADDFFQGSLGIGTDNYVRGTVDLNERAGERLGFRLAAMFHQNDVPDRGGPDNRRIGIAPSVTLGLDEQTRATLSFYHLESNDTPDSGAPYNNPFSASSPYAHLNGDGSPLKIPHGTYYGLHARDYQKQTIDIGTIRLEHDFTNGFRIRNTTVHGRSRNDYVWTQPDDSQGNFLVNGSIWRRQNNRVSDTTSTTNQTDLTGSFATGSITHDFAIGTEIAKEETYRDSYSFSPALTGNISSGACSARYGIGASSYYWCAPIIHPNPNDPWDAVKTRNYTPTTIATDTRSAWIFDTLTLDERWLLNLGIRYDNFKTESTTVAAATGTVTRLKNDSGFWNYQTGLVFKPTGYGSIYASYGTSSNPPGVDAGDGADGISVSNQDLKPEDSRNIELGTKWELFDRRVSLSAAIFRTEKTNARVALGSDRGSPQVNAGKQRVDGIEVSISGYVTGNWNVFAGYTYLDSEILKSTAALASTVGNRFPNTPKNSASLWTTYAVTPAFTVGAGAFYMDKVFGNIANTQWVPSYTRFDAMASYAFNHNYSVQLNIQNLTDKYYYDKAYAAHYASIAPGRSATLIFHFRFD
ncbi:MAG: TonB-dependent siderophore receptor [Xanthomonadaceae bacterium]|jgi:catecholate siderophore receptor|nr:TonB-dependent siderophore receptor [Xanthomonadaceae bacterium]